MRVLTEGGTAAVGLGDGGGQESVGSEWRVARAAFSYIQDLFFIWCTFKTPLPAQDHTSGGNLTHGDFPLLSQRTKSQRPVCHDEEAGETQPSQIR